MVTNARVYDHTGSLVYHNNVIILVDNIEGYILGHNLLLMARIWHHDRYLVERFYLVARLLGFAINEDILAIGSRLDAVARGVLKAYGEVLVETHLRLTLIYSHRKVLIHLITLVDALCDTIQEF